MQSIGTSVDTKSRPLSNFLHRFYDARRLGQPEALRPFIAADVVWEEPEVGEHMGRLLGVEAVLNLIARALAVTDGTFQLDISEAIETTSHCSAVISWSATRDGKSISGRELAIFRVVDQQIKLAAFYPENIANDHAFWGTSQ